MSLLLDALKKAAEEKSKSDDASQNFSTKVSMATEIPSGDSLELELDHSAISEPKDISEDFSESTIQNSDEFPVVDKTTQLTSPSKNITIEKDNNVKIKTAPTPDKTNKIRKSLNANISPTEAEKNVTDQKPTRKESIQNIPGQQKTSDKISAVKSTDTSPDNDPSLFQRKQSNSSNDINIEKEKVLSELINNSNQHNKSERFKRNISIAVLITLIIIGCGLYFFIEIQTTNQNIYLPQDTLINSKPPSTAENLKVADIKPKTSTPPTPVTEKQAPSSNTVKSTAEPYKEQTVMLTKRPFKPVKFVRTVRTDPVHKLLMQAYNAFYNQQYKQSEILYKDILLQEKNNRDALLGLAAIAIKQNRFEYARQKYRYLLKLNPRDSLAIAGISSIEKQTNLQLSESKLKFMIKNNPGSAHLYFALGSLYARQKKWPNAQSAYFSAWSASSKNADYAFNLAISLDHLDKKKQALQFYQHCLKLKQSSHTNFSATKVEKRISTLQKSLK